MRSSDQILLMKVHTGAIVKSMHLDTVSHKPQTLAWGMAESCLIRADKGLSVLVALLFLAP